jgi:dihydroorotate dehydrogenase (NAD+) catalytic subunit
MMANEERLLTPLGSLILKNPVIAASGTFGYGLELLDFCPPEKLGAVICKGLSLEPWPGNPGPRICETPGGGLINAIGLENMGAPAFIRSALPALKNRGATVGANILGRLADDYLELARLFSDSPVDFLELNVSCPNLKKGGLSFGSDPDSLVSLSERAVKAAGGLPVWVKLPPLLPDVQGLCRRLSGTGIEAVSLINSLPALKLNPLTLKPELGNVTGGLSGAPIKPLALRQVFLAAQGLSLPVVGLGGIFAFRDGLEFLAAGAAAFEVGTATLVNPRAALDIAEGLDGFLEEKGMDLAEFRLSLREGPP